MDSETRALQPTSLAISRKSDFVKRGKSPFFPLDFDPYDVNPSEIPIPDYVKKVILKSDQNEEINQWARTKLVLGWYSLGVGPFDNYLYVICPSESWFMFVQNQTESRVLLTPEDAKLFAARWFKSGYLTAEPATLNIPNLIAAGLTEIEFGPNQPDITLYQLYNFMVKKTPTAEYITSLEEELPAVEQLAFGASDESFPIVQYGYLAYLDGRGFYVPNSFVIDSPLSHAYHNADLRLNGKTYRVFVIKPTFMVSEFYFKYMVPCREFSTYETFADYEPISVDEMKELIDKASTSWLGLFNTRDNINRVEGGTRFTLSVQILGGDSGDYVSDFQMLGRIGEKTKNLSYGYYLQQYGGAMR